MGDVIVFVAWRGVPRLESRSSLVRGDLCLSHGSILMTAESSSASRRYKKIPNRPNRHTGSQSLSFSRRKCYMRFLSCKRLEKSPSLSMPPRPGMRSLWPSVRCQNNSVRATSKKKKKRLCNAIVAVPLVPRLRLRSDGKVTYLEPVARCSGIRCFVKERGRDGLSLRRPWGTLLGILGRLASWAL